MVDVVFVLMLFFMASAGSQVLEKELSINLPSRTTTGKPIDIPIIIDIGTDGLVSMNNAPFGQPTDHNLNALRDWFKSTITTVSAGDRVIIKPTPDVRQERIVEVLNAANASGVKNLTFN